jgi:hypothetical protein
MAVLVKPTTAADTETATVARHATDRRPDSGYGVTPEFTAGHYRSGSIRDPRRPPSYNPDRIPWAERTRSAPLTTAPRLLSRPVEYGDMLLAPTTELAGLAELSSMRSHDERVEALLRIARAIDAEDAERDHIRTLRNPATSPAALPTRR